MKCVKHKKMGIQRHNFFMEIYAKLCKFARRSALKCSENVTIYFNKASGGQESANMALKLTEE